MLSGYLITGLLVSEYRKRRSIKLSAFWLRRARRLLPALLIVLVAVTLMVRFVEPAGLYPDFRMDALSALFYFSNWWQIAASSNYFVATGPASPLTHTWSLAVEEQFYLVWPLVVLAVLHFSRTFTRGLRNLLVLSVVGVVASALEMALLYHPVGQHHPALLRDRHPRPVDPRGLGAGLCPHHHPVARGGDGMAPPARSAAARRVLVVAGLAGFAGTLALTYTQNGSEAFDYRGGILLSALSAAAIITAAVCVPSGAVARFLSAAHPGVDRHHLLRRLPLALPRLHLPRRPTHRPRRPVPLRRALRRHHRPGRAQLLPGRAPGHGEDGSGARCGPSSRPPLFWRPR